ncbi:MAG: hypothetical protein WBA18_16840 [Terracidiphilus sp.]
MTAAGAGAWIGYAQDSPDQDVADSYITLPEGPTNIPSYPVTKQPEVILESAKPAAMHPANPVAEPVVMAVSETNAPANPAPQRAAPPMTNPAPQPQPVEVAEKPSGSVLPGDEDKQEVASEAADLLKMATALKSEVDKTTKDTLSLTVVRKAGEIEQLAHKVRLGTGKG